MNSSNSIDHLQQHYQQEEYNERVNLLREKVSSTSNIFGYCSKHMKTFVLIAVILYIQEKKLFETYPSIPYFPTYLNIPYSVVWNALVLVILLCMFV